MRRALVLAAAGALLVVCTATGAPAEGTPQAAAEPAAPGDILARWDDKAMDTNTLARVVPLLALPEHRDLIRTRILEARPRPGEALVTLLSHSQLAVRMAALELLEEMAGTDHGFNPWFAVSAPENLAALQRWTTWTTDKDRPAASSRLFTDEQRRLYIRDLIGDNADTAARARRMLGAEGIVAVGVLETFLNETPNLPPGARARIRQAQYQITLAKSLADQASAVAQQLCFGSRDQLLAALALVRGAGAGALPILREFIEHPDPLVRETAMDSLLLAGGKQSVELAAPLLARETDPNVIHGALRRIKDIPGPESEKIALKFLSHPEEDLLISALQTCVTLTEDAKKAKPELEAAILTCLSDPRWRVRATALEYVARRRPKALGDRCVQLLEDPDPFVRAGAVAAVTQLKRKDAAPKLRSMLLTDYDASSVVVQGYANLGLNPDAEMVARLMAAPVAVRLQIVDDADIEVVQRFAADPDPDVSLAALRKLAENLQGRPDRMGLILDALRKRDPEALTAIVADLDLQSDSNGRNVEPVIRVPTGPTTLDPLYTAFLGDKPAEPAGAPIETPPPPPLAAGSKASRADLLRELRRLTGPATTAPLRSAAILALVRVGDPEGFAALRRDLPAYTTAAKIEAAEGLQLVPGTNTVEVLTLLLRDPVAEVRVAAAREALSREDFTEPVRLLLDQLSRPDSPLQPHEVYSYWLESRAGGSGKLKTLFSAWTLAVLNDPTAPPPRTILALILARYAGGGNTLAVVKGYTTSANASIRRAAWRTLLAIRPAEIESSAAVLSSDPEAFVRVALPSVFLADNAEMPWTHHFSDTLVVPDARSRTYYSGNSAPRTPKLTAPLTALLERLSRNDPSPLVRFEASFALIAQGQPTDFDAFVSLVSAQPQESRVVVRISDWLEENASRATPALRPLLAIANLQRISDGPLKILQKRMGVSATMEFPTFASLAAAATVPVNPSEPLLAPVTPGATPAARASLDAVFFYKPGCPECASARELLREMKSGFPMLRVTEFSLHEPSSTVLNQALCDRFRVPPNQQTVAPSVFTQAGFLVRDIAPVELSALLARTLAQPGEPSWRQLDEVVEVAAAEQINIRYKAFTLPVILIAGLFDGLNPCAFATIIFFLSYLRIARRTKREMALVGIAFISAVFLAYFAAGLVLHKVLGQFHDRFSGLRIWLNWTFAALALVAALLSFRDALRARAGRLDEMTLQLPDALKTRIRGVLRVGARARRFILAAFVSGVLVSFLELACTGQVYAPIIYQIQQGNLSAVLWLAIYNLAFILPLVVIFLLAMAGMNSDALIRFQQRHTFWVKIALALVFLLLAGFIVFGDQLLHSPTS